MCHYYCLINLFINATFVEKSDGKRKGVNLDSFSVASSTLKATQRHDPLTLTASNNRIKSPSLTTNK